MAKSTPTEEGMGLAPSEEELASTVIVDDEDEGVPEPPETPAEAAPADKPADPPPADKPEEPRTVDVRAVQEARAEAREAKQRAAVLEQRWNEYLASQTKPEEKPAEDPLPDASNPLEQISWLVKEVQAGRLSREEATKRANEEGQRQEYARQVERVEADFKAKVPDYDQALQFAAKSRDEELQLMYPRATEQERRDYILQEWAQITQQSLNAGLNPAEQAYRFAEKRGYRKAEPAPAPKPDLAAVAAAQERHQSLSDAPGGETIAPLDAKALAKMTDKQFKAWMSQKGNEAKLDEILGR